MADPALTRRQLLQHCAVLASLPLLQACDTAGTSLCIDPELLSRGEEQMRKTLQYVDASSVAEQQCNNCQFFSAPNAQGCGHCEILDGPAHKQGYCTSWAQRS
jgi:hypothetical protein